MCGVLGFFSMRRRKRAMAESTARSKTSMV
ncbi:MAG: hypothetical protein KDK04_20620 [Candidatus Competibacteraceae bacterium]|nr:hypothetical protein [Candidatus Competibacteraceae bacterium]